MDASPRRWRWVVRLNAASLTAMVIGMIFRPGPLTDFPEVDNPTGIAALLRQTT